MSQIRRRWTWTAMAIVVGMVIGFRALKAIPTAVCELDGNAVVNNAPCDDWANTVPTKQGASEALASVVMADWSGNTTIMTTGGSKDVSDINSWSWKDQLGGLPDKDNITNAYAAAYLENGDLVVYFGADRFANSGDAQMGFWFFKQQVVAVPGQPAGNFQNGSGQVAVHSNGDVLVLANVTNGGAVVTTEVLEWQNGALVPKTGVENSKCGTNTDPNVCAISNDAPTTAPWAYTPKSGPSGTFPTFSFIEGGVNLTQILGANELGCFSSFMAETRSSQSESATLKDFALGSFNTCAITIVKDCPPVSFDPSTNLLTYTFNVTVTNSGFGPIFDIVVTDNPQGQPAQTFTSPTLAAGASVTF